MRRVSPVVLLVSAAVWWLLATPHAAAPVAALLAVGTGGLLHLGLGGRGAARISLTGLVGFVPFFLIQSLQGGTDVARRAFSPSLPLSPGFLRHRMRLQPGTARVFFVNCVSLLPGTLSARLEGEQVTVHLLTKDPGASRRLDGLEARVARLFGEPVPDRPEDGGGPR